VISQFVNHFFSELARDCKIIHKQKKNMNNSISQEQALENIEYKLWLELNAQMERFPPTCPMVFHNYTIGPAAYGKAFKSEDKEKETK